MSPGDPCYVHFDGWKGKHCVRAMFVGLSQAGKSARIQNVSTVPMKMARSFLGVGSVMHVASKAVTAEPCPKKDCPHVSPAELPRP